MESEDEKIAVRCDLASSTLTFRQFSGGIVLIQFDNGDVGRIGLQGIDRAESAEKDRSESTPKVKHVEETRMNNCRTLLRIYRMGRCAVVSDTLDPQINSIKRLGKGCNETWTC